MGADGWLMLTWPVMELPSARPAEMWWVKLELIAGRTATEGGMEQITESRYMDDSRDPEKMRALFCLSVEDDPRIVSSHSLPGQKHVPDAGPGEVKDRVRARPLDDLQVESVQDGADELPLRTRHEPPQQRARLDDV